MLGHTSRPAFTELLEGTSAGELPADGQASTCPGDLRPSTLLVTGRFSALLTGSIDTPSINLGVRCVDGANLSLGYPPPHQQRPSLEARTVNEIIV